MSGCADTSLGPAEEGVVDLEGDVVVVVGVAAEQEGAGVPVKWVGDEPHGTCHRGHHHLGQADM